MRFKLLSFAMIGCLFIWALCETSCVQENGTLQSNIDSFVADMNDRCPEVITDGLTLFSVSVNHNDKLLVYNYICDIYFNDLSSSEKNEFYQLLSTVASDLASSAYKVFRSDKLFNKLNYTQRYRFYSNVNALIRSFDVSFSTYSKAHKVQDNSIDGKINPLFDEYSGNHIEFLGVPVTGNVFSFYRKLPAHFSTNGSKDGSLRLKGEYIGKQSSVFLHYTPISNTIYRVSVVFKREDDWRKVKNDYLSLKKDLSQKYGSPIKSKEEFHSPYKEGDGREYNALKDGKATWRTEYRVDGGSIKVSIISQRDSGMTVVLTYIDSINSELNDKEKVDSL